MELTAITRPHGVGWIKDAPLLHPDAGPLAV
jgi:hypothetical protein